ncbi:HAD family hydrolase [Pontibacter ruber]|uniref:HAD family hydrolase n=1 Tax=Pontibacter ruber TaxID=1343895 RepID=A0ABW5CSS3_9BACT|nr:beta-phosphoglucomutase family hydrolase [Pontibacter ruber]
MSNLSDLLQERNIKALILDMDGVLTNTAGLHAQAWKTLCDSFLRMRKEQDGKAYEPFDLKRDYQTYVHDVPRLDAMRNFMASRGITLPEGNPTDSIGDNTLVGLGERKDYYFHELLKHNGVDVFDDAVKYVKEQQQAGMKTAIVSGSRNCLTILRRAGLDRLFEVRVDKVVANELKLSSKPAPDIYLEAARRLGVDSKEAAVFEDTAAGIKGAKAGGFGLIVGVDRSFAQEMLESKGADTVIKGFAAELKPKAATTQNS